MIDDDHPDMRRARAEFLAFVLEYMRAFGVQTTTVPPELDARARRFARRCIELDKAPPEDTSTVRPPRARLDDTPVRWPKRKPRARGARRRAGRRPRLVS